VNERGLAFYDAAATAQHLFLPTFTYGNHCSACSRRLSSTKQRAECS
jgi:hypothetical protein